MTEGGPSFIDVTMSNYNRQHPLEHDPKTGESHDPVVKNIKVYRELLYTPQTITTETVTNFPLSVGILKSIVEVEDAGYESTFKVSLSELEQKYGSGKITDVFDYSAGLTKVRNFLRHGKNRLSN